MKTALQWKCRRCAVAFETELGMAPFVIPMPDKAAGVRRHLMDMQTAGVLTRTHECVMAPEHETVTAFGVADLIGAIHVD